MQPNSLSMKLESKKYLSDIEYSIGLIEDFLVDFTFTDYQNDLKTKSAVERQLGIIGEAVNNYKKFENAELSHSKEIIAFRNRLINAYNSLEDEIIWAIIYRHRLFWQLAICWVVSGRQGSCQMGRPCRQDLPICRPILCKLNTARCI